MKRSAFTPMVLTAAALASVSALRVATVAAQEKAPMQMEYLDRGLVAFATDNGVYLSWRMLGTESDEIAFDVFRSSDGGEREKLNDKPITDSTNYLDEGADGSLTYVVQPSLDGEEGELAEVTLDTAAEFPGYVAVPIETPEGYNPGDGSLADLDGDGSYEIILQQEGRSQDNSRPGITDPVLLQAYTLEGEKLWEINLGKNIRSGAHYTQFQVYDYDGDGRAELICKTADGAVDSEGNVIGNADADHRNEAGYILRGPEYLTVFDGLTGVAIDSTRYLPQRMPGNDNPTGDQMKQFWGDGYGNRLDRFLAGTAYLDGETPSAIFSRGVYTRTYVAAYDFDGENLELRWLFDSEAPRSIGSNPKATDGRDYPHSVYSGQGFHSLSIADTDNDGKHEVVYGAMVVDDDGTGLFSTGLGVGDAQHVGDLDPTRPGIEVFGIQERFDDAGAYMYDGETGEILWKISSVKAAESGGDRGEGPGRGVAFDVDPRYPGVESWTAGAGITGMWDAKGNEISRNRPGSMNFAVWWDGDLLREILDRNWISKWNWETEELERLVTAEGARSNNGSKATPTVSADLWGDWREEVILPAEDGSELRIYTSTIPTEHRIRTLMHDPQYRVAVAWQNSGYNQPPHPSFYIGPDMENPPQPNIEIVAPAEQGESAQAD